MAERCQTLYDPDTGQVIATVLGPRPLEGEALGHMFAVIRAAQVLAARDPDRGARQAERIRQVRAGIAARAARRRRLSAMRAAYRAKTRGRHRRG